MGGHKESFGVQGAGGQEDETASQKQAPLLDMNSVGTWSRGRSWWRPQSWHPTAGSSPHPSQCVLGKGRAQTHTTQRPGDRGTGEVGPLAAEVGESLCLWPLFRLPCSLRLQAQGSVTANAICLDFENACRMKLHGLFSIGFSGRFKPIFFFSLNFVSMGLKIL